MRLNRRCGIIFHEVKAENGFLITLQPGDNDCYISAYSGQKLLADFQKFAEE